MPGRLRRWWETPGPHGRFYPKVCRGDLRGAGLDRERGRRPREGKPKKRALLDRAPPPAPRAWPAGCGATHQTWPEDAGIHDDAACSLGKNPPCRIEEGPAALLIRLPEQRAARGPGHSARPRERFSTARLSGPRTGPGRLREAAPGLDHLIAMTDMESLTGDREQGAAALRRLGLRTAPWPVAEQAKRRATTAIRDVRA